MIDHLEFQHLRIFYVLRLDTEHTHALKLEGDRAGGTQISAILTKAVANIGHRTRRVVGGGHNDNGHTVRRIAFIDGFCPVVAIAPKRTLNGTFNCVARHADGTSVLDGTTERWIVVGIFTSLFYSLYDLANDSCKGLGHRLIPCHDCGFTRLKKTSHLSFSNARPGGVHTMLYSVTLMRPTPSDLQGFESSAWPIKPPTECLRRHSGPCCDYKEGYPTMPSCAQAMY